MLRAHCGRHVYQVHISFLTGSMTMEAGVANCQSLGDYGATYCHQLQTALRDAVIYVLAEFVR